LNHFGILDSYIAAGNALGHFVYAYEA